MIEICLNLVLLAMAIMMFLHRAIMAAYEEAYRELVKARFFESDHVNLK
jgi:hypothetical protein